MNEHTQDSTAGRPEDRGRDSVSAARGESPSPETGAPARTEEEVLEVLQTVFDPEIHMNIVDLGLVYAVEPRGNTIAVDMTLTTPGCPLAATIMEDILREVREGTGIEDVQANLVWNPPWSLDFMSEEARLQLGYTI